MIQLPGYFCFVLDLFCVYVFGDGLFQREKVNYNIYGLRYYYYQQY